MNIRASFEADLIDDLTALTYKEKRRRRRRRRRRRE